MEKSIKKKKKVSRKERLKQVAAGVVIVAGVVTTGMLSTKPEDTITIEPNKPSHSSSVNNKEDSTKTKPEDKKQTKDNKPQKVDTDNYEDIDYTKSDYKPDYKPNNSNNTSTDDENKPQDNVTLDPDQSAYKTEIQYKFENPSDYAKTIIITIPDNLSIDIVDMMFKNDLVASGIMPSENQFTSIPLIFDNLENISFKLHRLGDIVGEAIFINGKLMTNAEVVE